MVATVLITMVNIMMKLPVIRHAIKKAKTKARVVLTKRADKIAANIQSFKITSTSTWCAVKDMDHRF
jgi:multisubunit Na+/H+ antiporter MnhG subunit